MTSDSADEEERQREVQTKGERERERERKATHYEHMLSLNAKLYDAVLVGEEAFVITTGV